MIAVDDILILRDLGIGAVGMYIFFKFATMVTNNAAAQMLQLHSDFLAAYKENTKVLSDLVLAFNKHIDEKDAAIELLRQNYKEKNDQR